MILRRDPDPSKQNASDGDRPAQNRARATAPDKDMPRASSLNAAETTTFASGAVTRIFRPA